eukprot:6199529-Pleurochrysis_carterae.AAC.2
MDGLTERQTRAERWVAAVRPRLHGLWQSRRVSHAGEQRGHREWRMEELQLACHLSGELAHQRRARRVNGSDHFVLPSENLLRVRCVQKLTLHALVALFGPLHCLSRTRTAGFGKKRVRCLLGLHNSAGMNSSVLSRLSLLSLSGEKSPVSANPHASMMAYAVACNRAQMSSRTFACDW